MLLTTNYNKMNFQRILYLLYICLRRSKSTMNLLIRSLPLWLYNLHLFMKIMLHHSKIMIALIKNHSRHYLFKCLDWVSLKSSWKIRKRLNMEVAQSRVLPKVLHQSLSNTWISSFLKKLMKLKVKIILLKIMMKK